MEASSHGLDQRRLDGVRILARWFYEFHPGPLGLSTRRLRRISRPRWGSFTRVLGDQSTAVVNLDDPKGAEVAEIAYDLGHRRYRRWAALNMLTYSFLAQRFDATGQDLRFDFEGRQPMQERLNLIGGFQADNVLLAAALVIACGADADEVFDTLPHLTTVRGRMELAATRDNGAAVFVDYAHTPDAVAKPRYLRCVRM